MKLNEHLIAAALEAHEFEPTCEMEIQLRSGVVRTCERPACWVFVPVHPNCHCQTDVGTQFFCEPCRAMWCAAKRVVCGECGCVIRNDPTAFRFVSVSGG